MESKKHSSKSRIYEFSSARRSDTLSYLWCLSVRLSVWAVCLVSLSVSPVCLVCLNCLSVSSLWSLCLSLCLFVSSVWSVCLSVFLSCLYVCLSVVAVCLSVRFFWLFDLLICQSIFLFSMSGRSGYSVYLDLSVWSACSVCPFCMSSGLSVGFFKICLSSLSVCLVCLSVQCQWLLCLSVFLVFLFRLSVWSVCLVCPSVSVCQQLYTDDVTPRSLLHCFWSVVTCARQFKLSLHSFLEKAVRANTKFL